MSALYSLHRVDVQAGSMGFMAMDCVRISDANVRSIVRSIHSHGKSFWSETGRGGQFLGDFPPPYLPLRTLRYAS